jgi:hypothetical protein
VPSSRFGTGGRPRSDPQAASRIPQHQARRSIESFCQGSHAREANAMTEKARRAAKSTARRPLSARQLVSSNLSLRKMAHQVRNLPPARSKVSTPSWEAAKLWAWAWHGHGHPRPRGSTSKLPHSLISEDLAEISRSLRGISKAQTDESWTHSGPFRHLRFFLGACEGVRGAPRSLMRCVGDLCSRCGGRCG